MNFDVVIVRYSGEIGIKGKQTRKWMEKILTDNIRIKLEKEELDVKEIIRKYGRIYIYGKNPKAISKTVSNVFGVVSTSPAIIVDSDVDEICKTSRKVAEEILDAGDSFRITTRRVGTHPFTSEDISIKAGAAVLDQMSGKGVSVNLNTPDKQIFIEIRHEMAYLFHEVISAVGGMPTGTQGKIAIIISCDELGWIAAFLIMKRGCEPVPIIFNIHNSLNSSNLPEKIPYLSALKTFIPSEFSVFLVPFTAILEELKQLIPKESLYLFCRKLQLQIAEHLCKQFDMKGIVTGDLLDCPEKSKIYNLVDTSVKLPIYRPLISLDAEKLTKYKNLLGISGNVSCPSLCKDTTISLAKINQTRKITFEKRVNSIIEEMDIIHI
ncbi:tRNA sulfurtransferase [Candidatus Borrarchaeum sp.]|uniref:tRNA sulfurtransferase n=1 Tax=Candidatus Borrarchaeum sp. TaxID=2846742 RepID=UPI00257AAFA7|nr:THUMP domain-containing protein [Candidatus Borrarchaeum sp.]